MRYYTPPTYEPTTEEIRAACERLQDGWSPAEERRHRGLRADDDTEYTIPRGVNLTSRGGVHDLL